MDDFRYSGGQLFCEDVSLSELAEVVGTPTYVYSRNALEQAYLSYAEALEGSDSLVCFAVKANSNLGVLGVLAELGAGFDIVSLGELERCILAGADPKKIVFSGVGKQPHEIRRALELSIHCFNIESEPELDRINQIAAEMGEVAPVSFRVNPDVDAGTHPYISTGLKENKFGIAIESAPEVYARAAKMPNIKVIGVDCHIGSQLTEVSPFLDALDRLLSLIDRLAVLGVQIEHLDLGGGLGVCYADETPPSPMDYIAQVKSHIGDRDLKLVFEPGRSIAANAGVLLTRVEYLKPAEQKNFAIIDAAMNDLIRPALYSAFQEIVPVQLDSKAPLLTWDLVGPICETGDFIGKERDMSLSQGDLLAVRSAGAYGFVMASNYNTRGRAAEVMVSKDQFRTVRERETFEDMVRGEHLFTGAL